MKLMAAFESKAINPSSWKFCENAAMTLVRSSSDAIRYYYEKKEASLGTKDNERNRYCFVLGSNAAIVQDRKERKANLDFQKTI